jgi:mannose/cellobiose epimerase-like protein (N-acyl-D-glucosamine 2-epimerase family)
MIDMTAGAVETDIVATLKALMIEHALPLWATTGWDHGRGGFVERLNTDGTAQLEEPRRVLVQARQIYCYAKAAQFEWYPGAKELAFKGLDYLLDKGRSPEGGFVHKLNPDGGVRDGKRDTYDHAFVLLALANVLQLSPDAQIRAEIDAVLTFLDQRLRSPHGGFLEGLPSALPRRQNPHMHLFESMIALFDATGDPVFQTRAGDFFSLFMANLFDQRTQVLGEYFEEDWSRINPVVVEPGHLAEWTWLLKGFERITGCPTGRHRSALMASLLRYRDAAGCLVDEGDDQGRITRASRRCWPQTEFAKAWIAQAESGESGAAEQARAALSLLKAHYLDHPLKGGWYDQFDGDGRSIVDFIPASSFYHVLCAVSEAEQVLQPR